MPKQIYVYNMNEELRDVTDRVQSKGWRVLGDWKLINPRPLPLTEKDYTFIASKLPTYLAERHPLAPPMSAGEATAAARRATYAFTILEGLCDDVYTIHLALDGKPVRIYIQKCVDNPEYPLNVNYPFRDEAWNKGLSTNEMMNVKD